MHQPYPSPPVAAREPSRQVASPSVAAAVRLMYAGAAVSVLRLIAGLASLPGTFTAIRHDYPGLAAGQLGVAAAITVSLTLVVFLVSAGLWVWMASANRGGHGWARTVATVLFGVSTLAVLVSLTQPGGGAWNLLGGILTWLIGLGVTLLLWRPDASSFFRAAAAYPRSTPRPRPRSTPPSSPRNTPPRERPATSTASTTSTTGTAAGPTAGRPGTAAPPPRSSQAASRSAPAGERGQNTAQAHSANSEQVARLARELSTLIAPGLERRLIACYGNGWLSTVNQRRRAEGRNAIRSLADHRACLAIYGHDPATQGWAADNLRAMAREMLALANKSHHDELLTSSDLARARSILREFRQAS